MTTNNESYLRPLFSDFASDKLVWNMADEFMFGHSILAAPIVKAQYTEEQIIKEDAMTGWNRKEVKSGETASKAVNWTEGKTAVKYLPKGCDWYDFWTGERLRGGRDITLQTSLDRVPMFVRAGSILPLAPVMEYVGQQPWNTLEIRVYPGRDADFTLYEDEGDNYNYERGICSTIPFHWNDRARTLTIGLREGSYPGMLQQRMFTIVLPDGTSRLATYDGNKTEIKL